jgi:D-tyrosyl-tRNA(Tyr) deacylase
VTGEIGPGLAALVGVTHDDTPAQAEALAAKLWHLRIFDERSVAETSRAVLVVSQFTLYGDTRRGRRPSWTAAARPEHAAPLVDAVVTALEGLGATVGIGRFGAHMRLALENDGPVTLLLEV